MINGLPEPVLVALIGLVGGGLLGLAARLGRFCTLGAIEDYLYQGSDTRLRMWLLAIGVAGVMAFGLALIGAFDPARSAYYIAPFSPLAHILGGLLFGYGMALAGNCGFGALARVGGGDLRSFVIVLVMGVSAYVMLSGPLAFLRVAFIDATAMNIGTRSYAEILSNVSGLPLATCGVALSGLIVAFALGSRDFLAHPSTLVWAVVVALAITLGWAGTNHLASNGFSAVPVQSHTFTAPLGETMLYLMTSSGGGLSFGVGSVAGVWFGAFCGSLIKGHFRWEACEDPRELRRQFFGAVLMGFGAVLALGCTIGQGISAFSVMALGAPLTFASIFAGAALGLRQLIVGFARV